MNDQKSNVLGETMWRARVAQGYDVWEVAKVLRVSDGTVTAWGAGWATPNGDALEEFAILVQRPLSIFYLPEPPDLRPRAEALSEAATAMHEAADTVLTKLQELLALHGNPEEGDDE